MKMSAHPHLARLLGAALLLCAGLAQAQYAWIDEKGVRQFSDRPPPPNTPASRILKAPGRFAPAEPVQAPEPVAADAKPAAKPTLADREADYKKRAQERAKQEQKAAEEAQRKEAQANNCEVARRSKAVMESGVRMREMDAHGEVSYMSDDDRAKRVAQANKVLEGCR